MIGVDMPCDLQPGLTPSSGNHGRRRGGGAAGHPAGDQRRAPGHAAQQPHPAGGPRSGCFHGRDGAAARQPVHRTQSRTAPTMVSRATLQTSVPSTPAVCVWVLLVFRECVACDMCGIFPSVKTLCHAAGGRLTASPISDRGCSPIHQSHAVPTVLIQAQRLRPPQEPAASTCRSRITTQ